MLWLLIISNGFMEVYGQLGVLEGKLMDGKGEAVIFATVLLQQNDTIKAGANTDFDGYYKMSNLTPGVYDLKVQYTGYDTVSIAGIKIKAEEIRNQDILMKATEPEEIHAEILIVVKPETPAIGAYEAMVVPAVAEGDAGRIGPGRENHVYYIDGVKVEDGRFTKRGIRKWKRRAKKEARRSKR